jgi:hypothetical protein
MLSAAVESGQSRCYDVRVKTTLCLSLALSSLVWANEASDRAAVEKVILGLNDSPPNPALFMPGFNGFAELARLDIRPASERSPNSIDLRNAATIRDPAATHVVISKEPWGEATLVVPQTIPVAASNPAPPDQGRLISRFNIQSVRFVAKDVALVEAVKDHYYERPGPRNRWQSAPALFVVKKDRKVWGIDSVHVIAQP